MEIWFLFNHFRKRLWRPRQAIQDEFEFSVSFAKRGVEWLRTHRVCMFWQVSSACVQFSCMCRRSQYCSLPACSFPPAPIASALLMLLAVQLPQVLVPEEERWWNNRARDIRKGRFTSLSDTTDLCHFKQLMKLQCRAPAQQDAQICA